MPPLLVNFLPALESLQMRMLFVRNVAITVFISFLILTLLDVNAAEPLPPNIASISGASDGVGVKDGRWTGQPSYAPSTASNAYKSFYVLESQNSNYYWDIKGQNFTGSKGSVWLIDPGTMKPINGVTIKIVSWSDSAIRIVPTCSYTFTSLKDAWLAVSLDQVVPRASNVRTGMTRVSLVGMIQTRGYGQCTWFVSKMRLAAGLKISRTAFEATGTIPAVGAADNGYRPKQWDVLNYAGKHVAIISSVPVAAPLKADGSLSWSFSVTEMNAAWDEKESDPATFSYSISAPAAGGKGVVTGAIYSRAFKVTGATSYFR